ncbi:hypothetical protein [Pseudomonas sp. N040]|uniref:hypothetical protein n=1 Tax=Pseudomonas sp. N040 TaxID=2785325 RepID=UPI0018A2BF1E|nr:hypothetical protein [Pseudomonas sp. N040]MBF7731166.1 hypothetical protein [Pseudomonas sp. N040]MBW7014809.1 hypothetical protein [Pseudomonas sp. N040]
MKNPIHIVTEEPGRLRENYVLAQLAAHWQAWGHPISTGPLACLSAGLGIMHVNLTRVDARQVPATPDHHPLLNRQVLDISKSSFSSLRLQPDSAWRGPVIVKSDLNYFGNPERRLEQTGPIDKAQRLLARKSWQLARRLPANDYPVLAHIVDVPGWVWRRHDLIVERFLPERVGDLYAIRGWLFFGTRGYAYRLYSRSPVVKAGNITHFDILNEVPEELQSFRRQHGFDFGKFDYVEVEGRAVLLDLNKTPTTVAKPDSPRMRDLAEGLHDFPGMGEC